MAFPRIDTFDRQLAIVVGIDHYANGLPPLANAIRDAERIAELVSTRHAYDVIFERDPSLEALTDLFNRRLAAEAGSGSQVLIYFAGHGIAREREGELDGFLLPSDAGRAGERWLPMDWLRERLAAHPCRHLLLLLDCCFAGAFGATSFRDVETEGARELYEEEFRYYIDRQARQLIASCAHDERALDLLRSGDAPFARAIVDALGEPRAADVNRDGIVTAADLYAHVRHALKATARAGFRQTPNLWPLAKHDSGEYVFRVAAYDLDDAPPIDPRSNPYRGLDYFDTAHSEMFHGRSAVTAELVERITRSSLTVLLGASGSGKSSVLHAGLVPALGATHHVLGPLRIGRDSMAQLDALADRPVPAEGAVCVLVDQLDELLSRDDRVAFQLALAQLLPAADVGSLPPPSGVAAKLARLRGRARIVLALRSDTEPHFIAEGALGHRATSAWQRGRVFLRPMNREELRACIEGPAANKVVFFSSARRSGKQLVDAILDEVDQTPGALPLLSVALARMYARFAASPRKNRTIDWDDYLEPGGVTGALQAAAESLYDATDRTDRAGFQATFQRVVLRMVTARGTEVVRRPVLRAELHWDDDEDKRVTEILALLARERLTIEDAAPNGDTVIVPAHDALLTGWPTLKRWIDEGRGRIEVLRLVGEAVREPDARWDPERLARLDELASPEAGAVRPWTRMLSADYPVKRAPPNTFTAVERDFVVGSLRANRRRRVAVAGAIAGAFAALAIVTAVALNAKDREHAEKLDADSRAMAARAHVEGVERLQTALRLAVDSYRIAPTAQAREAMLSLLNASPRLRSFHTPVAGKPLRLACDRDSELCLASLFGSGAVVWTLGNERASRSIAGASQTTAIAVQPGGKRIALGGDTDVRVIDPVTHVVVDHIAIDARPSAVAFSADGTMLAVGDGRGRVHVWAPGQDQAHVLHGQHGGTVNSVAFGPAGMLASAGDDGNVIVRDGDGAVISTYRGTEGVITQQTGSVSREVPSPVYALAWTPDGRAIVSSGYGGAVVVRQHDGSTRTVASTGDLGVVQALSISDDGKRLLTATTTQKVHVWNLPRRVWLEAMTGHEARVAGVAFLHGHRAVSVGEDGGVLEWDVYGSSPVERVLAEGWSAGSLAFDAACTVVAGATRDGRFAAWDAVDGRQLRAPQPVGAASAVAVSPDGKRVAYSTAGDAIVEGPLGTPGDARTLLVATSRGYIRELAYASDGRHLWAHQEGCAPLGNCLRGWDLRDATHDDVDVGPFEQLTSSLAPDGAALGFIKIDPPQQRSFVVQPVDGPVVRHAMSDDGATGVAVSTRADHVAIATFHDSIVVFDRRDHWHQPIATLSVPQGARPRAFSGDLLVATRAWGGVVVMGVSEQVVLGTLWKDVETMAVCPSKPRVAGVDYAGRLIEASLSEDALIMAAERVAGPRPLQRVE